MDVSQNYKRLKHWPYLVAQKKKKKIDNKKWRKCIKF